MLTPERRQVAELITRLELEPYDSDIFVEGPTDAALIDWYLRQHQRSRYKVFLIEDIHLPDHDLPRGRPQSGHRDRVIALSDLLSQHFEGRPAPALCIADQDLDVVFGAPPANEFLLYTDGTSIESLFFTPEVLDRFQSLFLRRRALEPTQLMETLSPILEDLFFVRAADRSLNLGAGFLSPSRCCAHGAPGLIEFDLANYLSRYLGRVAGGPSVDEFRREMAHLRRSHPAGSVQAIHGKDFVELLCWALRPYVNDQRLVQPAVAHRGLMTSLDLDQLDQLPMFQRLLQCVIVPM